jgi:hypothetical protein
VVVPREHSTESEARAHRYPLGPQPRSYEIGRLALLPEHLNGADVRLGAGCSARRVAPRNLRRCASHRHATRLFLCFFSLPALWIAVSLATDVQAILMVPAAVVTALLSALTAYRSGRGALGAFGYFLGTSVMMGVAFAIAVAVLLEIYCEEDNTGDC